MIKNDGRPYKAPETSARVVNPRRCHTPTTENRVYAAKADVGAPTGTTSAGRDIAAAPAPHQIVWAAGCLATFSGR